MIPTSEMCFDMMEKYGMLDNIRAHSIMVEKVAVVIARGNMDVGADISIEKVVAGALLHDIAKTPCLYTDDDHALKGSELCVMNNFGEIADIVKEHVRLGEYEPDCVVSEKEIIYYSDKRVNHDTIVSLDERLSYLLERYAKNKEHLGELIKKNFMKSKEVERKLFAKLHFNPEDIESIVKQTSI